MKNWIITKMGYQGSPIHVSVIETETADEALCRFIALLGVLSTSDVSMRKGSIQGAYILDITGRCGYSHSDLLVVEVPENVGHMHVPLFLKAPWEVGPNEPHYDKTDK